MELHLLWKSFKIQEGECISYELALYILQIGVENQCNIINNKFSENFYIENYKQVKKNFFIKKLFEKLLVQSFIFQFANSFPIL